MHTVALKPLSQNKAWKGQRYKTPAYRAFELALYFQLPRGVEIPVSGPLTLHLEFGFSNAGADNSNPIKLVEDVLQRKYGFNDNRVYRHIVTKRLVKKGAEFIRFYVEPFTEPPRHED